MYLDRTFAQRIGSAKVMSKSEDCEGRNDLYMIYSSEVLSFLRSLCYKRNVFTVCDCDMAGSSGGRPEGCSYER